MNRLQFRSLPSSRVITAINNWGWMTSLSSVHLSYSSPMDSLVLLYFAESSFLSSFRLESVNVFVLPPFDFCTSDIFFNNKQFRTCANAFPNEFTVRSYAFWADQHWILSWMEEIQTATYFLRSRLFTYNIMKNFNCNISLWFFKSKIRSYIEKHFFLLK